MTPLREWSARRKARYLHNTQQTQETDIDDLGGIRTLDFQQSSCRRPTPLARTATGTETWTLLTSYKRKNNSTWHSAVKLTTMYLLHAADSFMGSWPVGPQLVKKFPAFYGTRRFITASTSARHLSLSWAGSLQSIPQIPKPHFVKIHFNIILPPAPRYPKWSLSLRTKLIIIWNNVYFLRHNYSIINRLTPEFSLKF